MESATESDLRCCAGSGPALNYCTGQERGNRRGFEIEEGEKEKGVGRGSMK